MYIYLYVSVCVYIAINVYKYIQLINGVYTILLIFKRLPKPEALLLFSKHSACFEVLESNGGCASGTSYVLTLIYYW